MIRPSWRSAAPAAAARADSPTGRGAGGRLPRSTTVSGQRASVAAVSWAGDGRYEPTWPAGLARASAAPGPTAVAHRPDPGRATGPGPAEAPAARGIPA